jgi:protein Mpv17
VSEIGHNIDMSWYLQRRCVCSTLLYTVAYDRALTRRPLVVKTLTSAAMFGLGDFMSQKLEGLPELDTKRMTRMIAWGAMFAPMAHGWYNLLESRLPAKGVATVVKKVAADQVMFCPLCP